MKKVAILFLLIVSVSAQSLSFNGSSNFVRFIGKYDVLGSTSKMSISAWIKPKKLKNYSAIISRWNDNDNSHWKLVLTKDGSLHFHDGTQGNVSYSDENVVGVDKWSHVAVVKNGTSVFYMVNGVNVGNSSIDETEIGDASIEMFIGITSGGLKDHFDGNIDEVAIWNSALSENEIFALYNSGKQLDALSNSGNYNSSSSLKGYWRMNKKIEDPIEGVTQVRALIDASGNDIEGTVAGAKWSADAPGIILVSSIDDLIKLSQNSSNWDGKIIQTNNIDASSTMYLDDSDDDSDGDKYNDPNDLTSEGNNEGFSPIGGYKDQINFTGIYDGKGFLIKNLYMDRESEILHYVGLFGRATGATLKNINLVNVNIIGGNYTGGLLGLAEEWDGVGNSIINCLTTGSVSSVRESGIGGLIGYAEGALNQISFSYSLCDVSGNNNWIGGLIGSNQGEIDNSYAFGKVSGNAYDVGGLVGKNEGIIKNSYSINTVNGSGRVGALVGTNRGPVSFSVWDKTISGTSFGIGASEDGSSMNNVSGKTTSEMKTKSTFTNLNWDFDKSNDTEIYWMIDNDPTDGTVNNGYPYFSLQLPVKYPFLSTDDEIIVSEFALHENYPNPFNPTTTLRFDLPKVSDITLTIYNMLGQKVRTFNYQNTSAGYHSVKWNATNDYGDPVGAGVYLYQLQTKDFVKTRKMVLLK